MPIYEYQCIKNNHEFEMLQKIGDPIPKKCIYCNSKVKKLISQSTFHLKGTGWYATDYASKSGGAQDSKKKPPKKEIPKDESTKKVA